MQNASGKQCLIATSLLVVILVATDADAECEKERRREIQEEERKEDERSRDEERKQRLSRPLALFRDNPISLRRFSIFTTSFELTADSVAEGHSKYSRNLVFTLVARGKSGGKDVWFEGERAHRGEKRRVRKDLLSATTGDRSAADHAPII